MFWPQGTESNNFMFDDLASNLPYWFIYFLLLTPILLIAKILQQFLRLFMPLSLSVYIYCIYHCLFSLLYIYIPQVVQKFRFINSTTSATGMRWILWWPWATSFLPMSRLVDWVCMLAERVERCRYPSISLTIPQCLGIKTWIPWRPPPTQNLVSKVICDRDMFPKIDLQ